ncbi:hypothetical protein LOTGIDRAFT_167640 [Lottia gigantea]|uniref:Phospholipase A2-like domain-containing protein n=1 Tax=Lottia gigantea TaxID=225164 RepID=V3ZY49_LOTGI|nr:hypothetical protein LOTGIDRAFT_167640 [Lottia gigantea]ESO85886.1 hypothetical protein LOTGIDRAFT_167640 [Lottia gigantea]
MSMIIAQTTNTYFGSDIRKSLGSLPGFPWTKYPGEKHLPGHNYTGPVTRLDLRLDENDKPKPGEEPVNRVDAAALKHDILYRNKDITSRHEADKQMIIELENIPNPTFKERIQRALIIKLLKAKMKMVNKEHLKERIGDVKRYFKRQNNNKDFIDDTKLQQEVTSLKSFIEEQLLNVVDKTQLQPLSSLISNSDDKITKQKVDIKQLIANINPVFRVRNTECIPTGETIYQLEGYGFILKIKVFSYISGNIKNIFDDSGNFNFRGKSLILFPVKDKIDSIFFSHPSNYFNARKIFEFINGGEYVENKDLEVNDENNKPNHMYEIKTNEKYTDTFRLSIIPDNDNDILSIGEKITHNKELYVFENIRL